MSSVRPRPIVPPQNLTCRVFGFAADALQHIGPRDNPHQRIEDFRGSSPGGQCICEQSERCPTGRQRAWPKTPTVDVASDEDEADRQRSDGGDAAQILDTILCRSGTGTIATNCEWNCIWVCPATRIENGELVGVVGRPRFHQCTDQRRLSCAASAWNDDRPTAPPHDPRMDEGAP